MKLLRLIHPNWHTLFLNNQEELKDFMIKIMSPKIVPSKEFIFKAFIEDPTELKLVVVGQDPYPSKKHATGYAFDVPEGTTRRSFEVFQNIGKDYGIDFNSFKPLINNKVMLLNTNLSTEGGITKAHDWAWFTKQVINYIKLVNPSCQFVFLGAVAHKINTVNGINLYHPVANLRKGKKLLNKKFFELTESSVNWKDLYQPYNAK